MVCIVIILNIVYDKIANSKSETGNKLWYLGLSWF